MRPMPLSQGFLSVHDEHTRQKASQHNIPFLHATEAQPNVILSQFSLVFYLWIGSWPQFLPCNTSRYREVRQKKPGRRRYFEKTLAENAPDIWTCCFISQSIQTFFSNVFKTSFVRNPREAVKFVVFFKIAKIAFPHKIRG